MSPNGCHRKLEQFFCDFVQLERVFLVCFLPSAAFKSSAPGFFKRGHHVVWQRSESPAPAPATLRGSRSENSLHPARRAVRPCYFTRSGVFPLVIYCAAVFSFPPRRGGARFEIPLSLFSVRALVISGCVRREVGRSANITGKPIAGGQR